MKPLFPTALAALLLLSSAASVLGQVNRGGIVVPRPPQPDERRPPIIWINPNQGKLKAMQVQSVDVDIKVRGHLATTTIEMAFFNPNGRVLEGELIFPLGEGQTISGYALEVEGKLRQAVVVEKEKGREIFEEIVRRGVDPGLAELTKGNVFRTRVYPIPANGTKRLAVTFEQELADDGKGFRYLLPLAFDEKVGKFHARAEVVKQENAPMPDTDHGEALTFEKWRDSFVAELTSENEKHEKPLAFTVPKLADRPQIFLVSEKLDPARVYFHAKVDPEVPPAPAAEKPDKIALYYDASGSAAKRDRKREFDFLKAWMKELGNVTVGVVAIRNDADKPVTVEVKDGDASALIKLLEDLPLDGGTSLGAIHSGVVPGAKLAVVMSDGFSNFGKTEPQLSLKDGAGLPFTAIHAASMVDTASLERLARRTGGRVVNLLSTSTEDALAALKQTPFQFLHAKVISGKVTDMVPTSTEAVMRGFTFAGRSEGKGEIELAFGYGGKVMVTRRITLNPEDSLEEERGDFVRRAWAQRKIAELSLDPKENEAAIVALGKEHRIVTAGTSLLVLDRLEDYVRHHIQPPEADLQEKYFAMLKQQPKDGGTRGDEKAHLDTVAKQWETFKEWHGKRHPWLETVLKPTAEREAALYTALAGANTSKGQNPKQGTLSAEDASAARALADKAKDLAERWQKEGKNEDTRAAWIEEASNVLLAVDVLRQRRLELMPQSEPQERDANEGAAGGGFGRGLGMGGASGTAPPRPMSAPAPASDSFAAPASPPAAEPMLRMASGGAMRAESKNGSSQSRSTMAGSIEVKAWDPDTPYLKKIRKADDAYEAYLKERKENASSSAFFLDCADYFREEKKDDRLALRVLSNLAELDLENAPLLRILAYRLQQLGQFKLAVPLFEEVLKMRGEEPQSRRDLALCVARMEHPDLARAATLLWEVVRKNWDGRFNGIEVIALHELNDILQHAPKEGPAELRPDVEAIGIQKRFIDDVPLDLRVALTWDADNTDIDLWVIDPTGEVCIFNHNQTKTGGAMSNDFTRGYGPEIFTIRRALPGTYTVKVNYYGNTQQKLAGATTVQVEFQTSFDQPGTKHQAITRRLTDKKEVIEVGKFVFKPVLEAE